MNVIKHENHTPAPVCISLHASKPSGTCTAGKTLCPLSQQSHPKYRWFKSKMQKKRTTKHLQNVQDVVIIPICRPTLHLCHTIPLPYRILLVMGPLKKKNKACGWPKAPGFHGIPSGTQTWFAGKSTIYGGLSNKTLHLQGVFHCHASACLTTRGAFPFFLIIGGSCPPWKKCWRTIAGVPKLRCKLVGVVSLPHYIATYFVGEIQCLHCILYWILAILYFSPTLLKFVIEH